MHLMNQILIMTLLSKRYLHYNQISSIISIYVPFPDQFVLHTLIRKLTVSIQTNAITITTKMIHVADAQYPEQI